MIREPTSYVGTILIESATPILLGSWWALISGGLDAILFVVRETLEARTLQVELDGCQEYAQRTRYQMLPGVWWSLGLPAVVGCVNVTRQLTTTDRVRVDSARGIVQII